MALRDVNVSVTRGARLLEESQPMAMAGLVRADLGRDDRKLERDADSAHRRFDEVAVAVGKDRELPAARARIFQRRSHVREGLPGRQRRCKAGRLALACAELAHGSRHHLPVGALAADLKRRLVLAVALEPLAGPLLAEDAHELAA